MTSTERPRCRASRAMAEPAGPPPMTRRSCMRLAWVTVSYRSIMSFEEGSDATVDEATTDTLLDCFVRLADAQPQAAAILDVRGATLRTRSDLLADAAELARDLIAAPAGNGLVGVATGNGARFVAALLAAWRSR